MSDTKTLRSAWEKAERDALNLQAERDKALAKVRSEYGDKLRAAVDEAAAAQKAYLDADAADGIAGRDDLDDAGKRSLAASLGLTLPE